MKNEIYEAGKLVKVITNDGVNIVVKDDKGVVIDTKPCTAEQAADYQHYVLTSNEAEIESQVKSAMTRLAQIRDASNPTNAQVIQAVKDMAVIQRRVIRALINDYSSSD